MRTFETVSISTPTVSEANRRDWHGRSKRSKALRTEVAWAWRSARPTVAPPCSVHLVRLGGRELDDDNLRSALKAVRDQVADELGLENDRDPRVEWTYAQEPGGKSAGARIELRPEVDGAALVEAELAIQTGATPEAVLEGWPRRSVVRLVERLARDNAALRSALVGGLTTKGAA